MKLWTKDLKEPFCPRWGLLLLAGGLACCGTDATKQEIVVNEVLAKAPGTVKSDWVELYNKGQEARDISGWSLRDNKNRDSFSIPAGTVIGGGRFLVVGYDETGKTGFSFGLGDADSVRLLDRETRLVDETQWQAGDAPEGQSWGRLPDGTGRFKTLSTPTPEAPNQE